MPTQPTGIANQQGKSPQTRRSPAPDGSSFLSVAAAARMLGVSWMTVHRAIQDGQIAAIRIRGRVIVPLAAIQDLADTAMTDRAHGGLGGTR
ncbi:MAG: helix-turn-helix domain-containing protein [Sporichthyaceae bacterium]